VLTNRPSFDVRQREDEDFRRTGTRSGRVSGEPILSEDFGRPSFCHFVCDLRLLCTGEDARGKREQNGILKFNVRAIHRGETSH
jgi:hypothetical protein